MGNDLMSYIGRLELMTFFTGYPLIYFLLHVISDSADQGAFINRHRVLLPFAYALIATLFVGLELRNMYPDYSFKNVERHFLYHFLNIWGALAVLFWIPLFSKKTIFSLLHSLVFFALLLKAIFFQLNLPSTYEMIQNDMKIYTVSLLVNIFALLVIVILYFIISGFRKK